MRTRLWLGGLLCLLCLGGAWFLWHHGNRPLIQKKNMVPTTAAAHSAAAAPMVSSHGVINTNVTQISLADWNTNRFAGRLSNTTKSIGQLVGDRHAILLANALIETSLPLNFVFPKNLQPQGDPGAYIVQARGPIDNTFRAMLAQAGATIVAYIPNDAYLVRASASVAGMLDANPQTQAVVPYEPYYKIQSPMLSQAVRQMVLPDKTILTLGLFADDAPATMQQIEKLGGQVVGQDQSPFGPVVRVIPPKNWTALATLSGVQIVEPFHPRALANDLSRATVGVAADSLTATNYLNLTGSNIIVEVNDTGIDANHDDLKAGGNYGKILGVIGDAPQSLVDTNGHGTHVAGIIAGDGAQSTTVTNAPGSTLPGGTGTNYQFRGMAPGATLYSVGGIFGGSDTNIISDLYFQEVPALTNALISNNSWVFEGDSAYDLSAASYDAAVRDALPFVSGSQPVLFVFAAGNAGNGGDDSDFGGGIPDSIESPATAKDVITVGAIQENRDITNIVTTINPDGTTNTSQPWRAETSTSYRVAGFSSRGNVGIGIEGTFGRYKPDVVAPGTFVVSTRSEQWDIGTYFYQDPTNNQIQTFSGLVVQPGSIFSSSFPSAPTNTVQLAIDIFPNADSPVPFPNLPIYVGLFTSPTIYDFIGANDPLLIPGDPNAPANYLQQIFSSEGFLGAFNYAVSNNTANPISFDLQTDVITTNGTGDYFLVLSNLDQSIGTLNSASTGPGPYYRYETGTSMSAADVSGTLALMQEFYVNAYGVRPSPAMLKAMLINGARATGFYDYQTQNAINYEGWGLINLPGSLPPGITNQLGQSCSTFIQDQNPANALATGDSQTWMVTTTNALPMHVTLAWTDPPGDPAAAIKLVNNLVLVVTNLSNPTNPIVYYGNDIPASSTVNSPHATNTPPNFDSINNVQNVNLPLGTGTNFSVTVMGYRVNVNAVTAQTNNVVQDYALVISCGNGQVTNVMTVTTPAPLASNPTGDQQVTYLAPSAAGSGTSFQLLVNQFSGASSPLLGTNTIVFPAGTNGFGPNNWQVTVGMTNQWHFYVVTNVNLYSNAAFITFNPNAPEPDTLAVPRMGVFGGTTENASRDADIDMYVTTDPTITNLNPVAISNAMVLGQIGGPPVTVLPGLGFAGASVGRGTTEVVVDTNAWSRSPNVYYIGVKSEDQMSAEYGFITIFSQTPFSQMNPNGSQTVNGQPVPMNIPDGSPALPGKGYVFGIAIFPMTVASVTLSDSIWHQNFGDLIGTLTLNGAHPDVLNNHDSLGNPPGPYFLTYDDSAGGGIAGSRPSDGPGTLNNYIGLQGLGVWMLTEVDDSLTQTGAVYSCNLLIQPHQKPTVGVVTNYVPGGSWVYNFIDVPPGATNLTVYATNLTDTANPPVELFVKFGSEPTTNSYDAVVQLTPNGFISLGPPLVSGRYFVGLFNPNPNSAVQTVTLFAVVGIPFTPAQTIYNSTDTPVPILDDAVTTDSIFVTNYALISSLDVALAVQHPRISDLVFHLISPDGTRVLLMENRGGTDPNGAGGVATVTNTISFANFSSGLNLLSLSGSATIISNSVLRLTPALSGQDGRAWLTQKQLCANGFDTTFHFRISGPFGNIFGGEPGGDGINFAVQKVWPTNLVESGIAGAYGTNSVNVFFNTFWNWPGNSNPVIQDLSDNSIGIGVNGLYVAQTDLNPLGINMSDGNVHLAHINYDGSVFNVWVDNVKVLANVPMPGLSPGVDSSGEGWVGFDAFCGAAYENHDILDWTFSNPLQQNNYLVFTENTNLTTTPIKFAAPPFKPGPSTNVVAASGFDSATPGDYYTASFNDGTNVWNVLSNQVSVVNDPANADAGSHFLALANGTVSNTLPTVAGRAYVLTFRYRGPAIDGWWRAESNTVDSIYSNNGTWINGAVYAVGEVGTTFDMNGVNNYVLVNPASSHWNFGQTTGFTIEGWINPSSTSPNSAIVEFERALGTTSGNDVGVDFSINSTGPGAMDGNIKDILGVSHSFYATNGIIIPNVWQHVALTYNKVSGIATCYHNGTNVLQTNLGIFTPETSFTNLLIGGRTTFINPNLVFPGGIDELSMYDRSLSDSEIQAISQKGPAGKFDPTEFGVSPPQSLAEAQVSVNGGAPINVFGDNISWQTETITFKATQNGTPLQITGVEPGMLLDSFSLAQTANDIYYLPEQSLDTYDGKNAHGLWTLEIQDDRAGATNPEPLLQSWQLRFNFVTLGTNIYPAVPLTLPQLPEQTAYPGLLFTVTNAAFGGVPPYSYALTSSVPFGPFPSIDTNGVITWTPSSNNPVPAVYMFTNIVTDISTATATDIFQVLLLPTNSQPAFPGAEGPGGPAIGGRGGDVYHVINVNDGGPGSLRYGITNTAGSRTIIFDVSGTINLQSNLRINDPYLTVAGQTAPGDGITLKGYTTSVQDAHDDVVRFLRCRPGDVNSPAFQDDSFHFVNVTNSIADHISASWSIDEALSTTYSTNVSVQWSIIADPLNHSAHYMDSGAPGFQAHGYGSLLRYGSGAISYHHNLYADNYSRNPRPGDNIQLDFINNVVFNWGIFAGYNEDDSASNTNGYTNFLNYVGNYFIAGSNTTANPNIAFQGNVPNVAFTQIYQGTNFIDNNAATNRLSGSNTGWGMFSGNYTQLAAPTALPGLAVTFTNPADAYEQVLAFAGDTVAGASAGGEYLLRDPVDTNLVTGVRNKSGQIIDFISSNNFPGVYLDTNSEATYTNYTGTGPYWQSQGITNFVGVNPWPVLDSAPQPLDSDGDGIPDYWETTLAALGQASMNPAVPNNNHLNPDGYTDLEHYINWLAGPHALTVSNTPVDVDLYGIVGRTGSWAFGVTNGTNGTITLGPDGHTATFMPTNNFFGFASFGFSATNLFTSNHFDVTVSVMVSMTNITYSSVLLSNAKSASNSSTNTVPANGIFYYLVKVPTNALFATNRLLSATGPVNLLFSGVGFPTGTNIGDYTLLTGATSGSAVLSTTSAPTNIVQGGTYYLGVQNLGGTPVTVAVEADFGYVSAITNVFISGPTITATNINGTNGFLLQWSGPTNDQYTIQWKTNLAPAFLWNSVSNPVINVTYTPTNGDYSWFDDGSLTGGWPPEKFYRVLANFISEPITNSTPVTNIVVTGTITPLTVAVPTNAIAAINVLFSATGPLNVYFNQTGPPTANTSAGDVLMLTNATSGTFVLAGGSVPPLVPGANYYLGLQNPSTGNVSFVFQVSFGYAPPPTNPPSITSITLTNVNGANDILLRWTEPTNYQFQVQWATNLAPAIAWHTISNVVVTWSGVVSPTNAADGLFQFLDDGSLTGGWGPLKFYRLVEYPYSTPIPQTLMIINTAIIGNAVQFQWLAPTNYQYQVLWTTNLGLPLASWSVLANPILGLSNGVYTFTDTNQTGPATSPKFFRLLEH